MMTNKTIGLFLLATTFLSSPVCAGAAVPITDDTEKTLSGDMRKQPKTITIFRFPKLMRKDVRQRNIIKLI